MDSLASGETIGPYLLVRPLGHGGMGQVWLAHDARLQRKVALKRLNTEGEDQAARERILREARAAARVSHPNVATIHDVLEAAGRTFIVMEYVEGESLADRLARGGKLPPDEVADIGRQLADGLAEAHAQGVIHRDLKPANVHMTPGGTVKILDFGVARTLPIAASATSETVSAAGAGALATDGVHAGTQAYMSPEQLLGRHIDHRSDIYSLGIVLFELLVGRRPFASHDILDHIIDVTTHAAPAAHDVEPDVPRSLSEIIAKTLARDPGDRYASAADLRDALGPAPRFAARAMLAGAAAAAVAIGLVAVAAQSWNPFGHPVRPAVVAVLPVETATADAPVEAVARGLESLVVSNLRGIRGLTVVSRAAIVGTPRDDLALLRRSVHADYAVDLAVTGTAPHAQLSVHVRDTVRGAEQWSAVVAGDVLGVERQLLEGLDSAFRGAGVWRNGLAAADAARLRRLPTANAAALTEYSQAQALIDRSDVPGNAKQAIDLLQSAIHRDAAFGLAQASLAIAYCAQYERTRDAALLQSAGDAAAAALRLASDSGQAYLALARVQRATGRQEDALVSLRRASQLQPDDDEPHRQLALVLAGRGQVDAAIAAAREAIALRPRSWTAHNTLGLIYYDAARYPEAVAEFRRVTEIEPGGARGYLMLGAALHKNGDVQQAIGNYEHAVRLSPNASAYSNLAFTYYQSGRIDDAIGAFQAAVNADPSRAVLRRNLGDALLKARRAAAARDAYAQCVELGNRQLRANTRDPGVIALIALCEAKLGRRGDAERHGAEAIALAPGDREVVYKNAAIAALFNDRARAINLVKDALKLGYQPQLVREDDDFARLAAAEEFRRLVGVTR